MFMSQEYQVCAGNVRESLRAAPGILGGLRKRKGEERSTRILSAKEEKRRP